MNRRHFFKVLGGAALAVVGVRTANASVCQRSGTDYVIETWTNGTNWFRRYRSGWVEQGGLIRAHDNNTSVILPIPMANANYWAIASDYVDNATSSGSGNPRVRGRTSTAIRLGSALYSGGFVFWEVKGMAA